MEVKYFSGATCISDIMTRLFNTVGFYIMDERKWKSLMPKLKSINEV